MLTTQASTEAPDVLLSSSCFTDNPLPFIASQLIAPLIEEPNYHEIMLRQIHQAYAAARSAIARAHSEQKHQRHKLESHVNIQPGDHVLLRREAYPLGPKKLYQKFKGPFVVEKQTSPVNFVIRELESHQTQHVHFDRLKKIPFDPYARSKLMPSDEEDSNEPDSPIPPRPVSKPVTRSPIITRQRGVVPDLPRIMPKPIEYLSKQSRTASR